MTAIIVVSKDTIIASMEFIDTGHLSVSTPQKEITPVATTGAKGISN